MNAIITRKNRRFGITVKLYIHETCVDLQCCKHGCVKGMFSRMQARALMAHPDKWCVGCANNWPALPARERDDEGGAR